MRWIEIIARLLVGFAAWCLILGLTKALAGTALGRLDPTLLNLGAALALSAVAFLTSRLSPDES